MRTFLAMEISDEVKKYLTTIAKTMAVQVDGVKWVKDTGQHITMKFFGEIEEDMASRIKDSISHIESKYAPFTVSIKIIDAFPDKRRARVIVVTLENGVDNIMSIYNDIEENLTLLGIEKEKRPLTPHITLGRRKTPGPLPEKALVKLKDMSFNVHSVVLFKSTLRPDGAIYTPVWEISLKGDEPSGT